MQHDLGRCLQHVDGAPHWWVGFSAVLEKILVCWRAMDSVAANDEQDGPLTSLKAELQEIHSLLQPISQLMVDCEVTDKPSGAAGLLGLAAVKLSTLDLSKPLEIVNPTAKTSGEAEAEDMAIHGLGYSQGSVAGDESAKTWRPHAKLTPAARKMRAMLLDSVNARWFEPRYSSTSNAHPDYVLDMQLMCHPATASLRYVDQLSDTKEHAAKVKRTITDQFVSLAVTRAEKATASAGGSESSKQHVQYASQLPTTHRDKRSKTSDADGNASGWSKIFANAGSKKDVARSNKFADLGLLETVGPDGPPKPSVKSIVEAELDEFKSIPGVTLGNLPLEQVLDYWKRGGFTRFPHLARAARTLLAVPASAAVVEKDFSAAGRLMASLRRTTDSAWIEMILFLHGNLDLVPTVVPELPHTEMENAIPERLRKPDPDLALLEGNFGPDTRASGP